MWSLRSRRRKPADQPMPNPTKAKADLERIRKQRPEVDALVKALATEQRLNSLTANVLITFRGGR